MKNIKLIIFVALVVILFPIVSILAFIIIKSPYRIVIQGHLEEYNQIKTNPDLDLLKTRLPVSASKVTYRIHPYMQDIEVNFKITEELFLLWSKEQKWNVLKISTPRDIHPISLNNNNLQNISLELKNGYYFQQNIKRKDDPEIFESMLTIYFDSDSDTCYYHFTLL